MRPSLFLLLSACAPSIEHLATRDGPPQRTEPTPSPLVDSGLRPFPTEGERVVDATDEDLWIDFDLDAGQLTDTPTWDLGFQRFNIRLNGGVSGDAGVQVAIVDTPFDATTTVPEDGWVTDLPDDDDDGVPEYAFEAWYLYDPATHTLTPDALVYLVQTTDSAIFKVEILDYYDDAGTPAMVRFRWALLNPS